MRTGVSEWEQKKISFCLAGATSVTAKKPAINMQSISKILENHPRTSLPSMKEIKHISQNKEILTT
jgi:hypothetical protein